MSGPIVSTLDIDAEPTISTDTGGAWTGCAVRVGSGCIDATTLKYAKYPSLREADYLPHFERVIDVFLAWTHRYADLAPNGWIYALEVLCPPKDPARYFSEDKAMARYFLADRMAHVLMGRIPNARLVFAGTNGGAGGKHLRANKLKNGRAPKGAYERFYPRELVSTRPKHFTRGEHPQGDRTHEQSAWDVAGEANRRPRIYVSRANLPRLPLPKMPVIADTEGAA